MHNNGSDFWRRQGDRFASDHGQWDFQARSLLDGATACRERYAVAARSLRAGSDEFIPDLALTVPASFLAAIAVELFLKAIALKGRPDLATTGTKPFYTHSLCEIAIKLTEVPFSESELEQLERLAATIEWSGRYPIPRWDNEWSRNKYDVHTRVADGKIMIDAQKIPGLVSDESWTATMLLIDKLRRFYSEQPK